MFKLSIAASIALVSFVMIGCGSNDAASEVPQESIDQFKASVPVTDAEKASIRVADTLNGEPISYNTILRTGNVLNGETFGLLKDMNDSPLTMQDGSNYICNGQFGGSGPDHTEFIEKDGKIFMITQFECQVGAIYQAELEQDTATGKLSAKNLKYISQASHHGGYVHCAGSKTPWNSFLGSEEYEPNAADLNITSGSIDSYYDLIAPYFGGDLTQANPYYYGWITEVKILNAAGDNSYTKHYSLGRFSHELSFVMPDAKTVYSTDDGTNDAFYMYIADNANDLSAGTLYAAKWTQTDSNAAGKSDITWIKLGHSDDTTLKAIVDSKPLFGDIFESTAPNEDGTCATGFTSVNTAAGHECLKVKDATKAAFLETRRYAAILGATTEFRKMEGLTYNPNANVLYSAISEIAKGMEDNKKYGEPNTGYDIGGNNDITLEYNKCGAVYEHNLASNVEDKDGAVINSEYVITNMNSIIAGEMTTYDENSTYANNSCNINSIASPDNLTFVKGTNTLIIGEDTSYHQNDMVWAFDVESKKLTTRVATTPYGSETTSPMYQDPINGFTYINLVTQHPYGESDEDKVQSPDDVQSYVGYIQLGN
ncbi:alkaline phosphatase PhoX [Sulfurimonas sp.]|uniref:PhoX family protein n=1 Tax=Sulfurimonas sp. TaxID=2022749 RepID=UPI002623EE23|nr:alkaline phosphatase PhoX [Sulfurimonas sp.]